MHFNQRVTAFTGSLLMMRSMVLLASSHKATAESVRGGAISPILDLKQCAVIPLATDWKLFCPDGTNAAAEKDSQCLYGNAYGAIPSTLLRPGKCCYHTQLGAFLCVATPCGDERFNCKDNTKYVFDARTSCDGTDVPTGISKFNSDTFCQYGNANFAELLSPDYVTKCCWNDAETRFVVHMKGPEKGPDPDDTPLVLIHGLHDGPSVWNTAETFFTDNKYPGKIYKFDYSSTTDDKIEDNATKLKAFLISQGINDRNINIVAHSMGGLVARWLRIVTDTDLQVDHFVTLATPNHGTAIADLCDFDPSTSPPCGASTREMQYRSNFLETLQDHEEDLTLNSLVMTWRIIGDGMVRSGATDTTQLPGGEAHSVDCSSPEVDGTTPGMYCADGLFQTKVHTSITRKKVVLEAVLKFLQPVG